MDLRIGESRIICVIARRYWTRANIKIDANAKYTFDPCSRNRWFDLFIPTRAIGYKPLFYQRLCKARVQHARVMQLIATNKKSIDDHAFVYDQGANTWTWSDDGQLYLFPNDFKGFYHNNFGRILVVVTRIR